MRHLHFLINSKAGGGRAAAAWLQLQKELHRIGEGSEVVSFTFSDAFDVGFDYSQLRPNTVLVVVGGDGSLHHAASIALAHDLVLGIIPAGTGNDFASTLAVPRDPGEALQCILSGQVRSMDIIAANKELILNAGGYGLDASVVHFVEANPWLKRSGSLSYSLSVPLVMGRFRPFSLSLLGPNIDEEFENVSLVIVANGPSFGGGMKIVPMADPFDGQIEVCVVAGISKSGLLRIFPRIFRGGHVSSPGVHIYRGERFSLKFLRSRHYGQYDGEFVEVGESIDISVLPKRLQVLG